MGLYRDEGVVLRVQKLGEADRIITLLTREHGRIRAVGKGVRRTRSKFGARLEPFTHVDLQIYEGRSLDVVQQAETIASYGDRMVDDYPRYTTGTAMLETAERMTAEENEPAVQQFLLLVGGLRTLAEGVHGPGLVLDAFLLRSLAVAGYARVVRRLRPVRQARAAPVLQRRGRRLGVHRLPARRLGLARPRDPRPAGRAALRRLGDRRRRPTSGTAARAAVWSPRTCSGISSAACGRCRWWSAPERDLTEPGSLSLVSPTEESRCRALPSSSCPPRWRSPPCLRCPTVRAPPSPATARCSTSSRPASPAQSPRPMSRRWSPVTRRAGSPSTGRTRRPTSRTSSRCTTRSTRSPPAPSRRAT